MCMQCNNENKQKFDMFFCFVIFAQPPLKSIATQSSVEEASSQSVGESYFIELITKASLRKFHPHEPCFLQDIGLKMEGSFFPFCSHEQRFRARNWDGCYGLHPFIGMYRFFLVPRAGLGGCCDFSSTTVCFVDAMFVL